MKSSLIDAVLIACCSVLCFSAGCSKEGRFVEPAPGFLVGIVTDGTTEAPIESCTLSVKLEPDPNAHDYSRALSDPDGYYRAAVHRKGRFYLFVRKTGYVTTVAEANLTGDTVRTDFELDSADVLN